MASLSLSLTLYLFFFHFKKSFHWLGDNLFQSPLSAVQNETEDRCWAQRRRTMGSEAGGAAAPAPLQTLNTTGLAQATGCM